MDDDAARRMTDAVINDGMDAKIRRLRTEVSRLRRKVTEEHAHVNLCHVLMSNAGITCECSDAKGDTQ